MLGDGLVVEVDFRAGGDVASGVAFLDFFVESGGGVEAAPAVGEAVVFGMGLPPAVLVDGFG